MLPAANRLNFPYTVLLALVGLGLGLILSLLGIASMPGPVGDFFTALHEFEITSEAVFFIFLPALVFESALSIDVRRLMDDIAPILLLAIVGLLISTFAIGYTIHWTSGMGLVVCLLLGAIVSATDPVAVVAIFKDLGAPKRLAILVEGESLFNDATAIVAFTILSAMLAGTAQAGVVSGMADFLIVFVGGIVVGYLSAQLCCQVLRLLAGQTVAEVTVTISLAYLSFILAEHYLHVSGVMAVVTAALVIGSTGRTTIVPRTWDALTETWEQIGFWANSVIFVLVGLAVPVILAGFGMREASLLVVLLVAAFVARAFIIFGLLPMFARTGLAQKVGIGYRSVMFWGGLRGAVSLALALAVMENHTFDPEIRSFIGVLVTGFVLFTLFVNATTIGVVMRAFGLDKLSAADLAIRNRALATALAGIGDRIEQTAKDEQLDATLANAVIEQYDARAQRTRDKISKLQGITDDDWLRIGLTALGTQESNGYFKLFADRLVAPKIARLLLARSNDNLDALKAHGLAGYQASVERGLSFDWRFRLALWIQRRIGISAALAAQLADRFEVLLAMHTQLRKQLDNGLAQLTAVVPESAMQRLREILQQRHDMSGEAMDALALQYPDYASQLQERRLGLLAVRLERASYQQMKRHSLIGKEVYGDLTKSLKQRLARLDRRPQLELGLEPENLIRKVPFLADLPSDRTSELARMLKPRLAIPGERIVARGDPGDAMYFISSGAAVVDLDAEKIQLGSGDFFGELALLKDSPRNADVTAKGFCDLLILWVQDFRQFLDDNPQVRSTIERVAKERLDYDAKIPRG
ncbi:MAG: cation:proton antiporter [Gammaproteobacteria bacterium]|nr:cation:proton antiporter [Gammaproteobacteria bacterium]NNF61300.1 cyclic nucleotide-binding domain-containing protein [Gammaproteobacteria bacterium]NNM20858.1 cyclic nucleotide-binding domain-containing protein [Gammaproteobacteria bacterium]